MRLHDLELSHPLQGVDNTTLLSKMMMLQMMKVYLETLMLENLREKAGKVKTLAGPANLENANTGSTMVIALERKKERAYLITTLRDEEKGDQKLNRKVRAETKTRVLPLEMGALHLAQRNKGRTDHLDLNHLLANKTDLFAKPGSWALAPKEILVDMDTLTAYVEIG